MPASSEPAPFVERYVAGWSLADRPASSIAFAGVTDAVLFSLLPRPDGSIDAATNGLTEARIAEVKARAVLLKPVELDVLKRAVDDALAAGASSEG